MNIRNFIRHHLQETLGSAEKNYFRPGKLSPRAKQIILHITGGDAWTKLISDIYYAELQQSIKAGNWAVSVVSGSDYEIDNNKEETTADDTLNIDTLRQIKGYYLQLKSYNKNIFPINGLDINGVDKNNVWNIIRSLRYRAKIIENIKKLPSIALRNMRNDIRTPRNSNELQEYDRLLEYFLGYYELLSNRDGRYKKAIENKMFRANITISDLLNFAEEKENLLGGKKFSIINIKKIVQEYQNELDIVYNQKNIMVIDVTSPEGIKAIGCNSLWCFTYGTGFESAYRNWSQYSTNGHVYVIINFTKESDSPDFMHVLIKPLSYQNDDSENTYNNDKLFNMANEQEESPLWFIDYTVGLKNAPGIFHFDISYDGPTSKWPYEDPNQLKLDLKEIRNKIREYLFENIDNEEMIQTLIDAISTDSNNPRMQKYKDILKNQYGVDYDELDKDKLYIESANLENILSKDKFMNWDNYVKYAKKIFQLRGMGTIHINYLKEGISAEEVKKILEPYKIEVIIKEYSGEGNYASATNSSITIPAVVDLGVLIHELGHVYDHQFYHDGISKLLTNASSPYRIQNSNEVFAENFMHFFLAPEQLKKYLPEVYDDLDRRISSNWKQLIYSLL